MTAGPTLTLGRRLTAGEVIATGPSSVYREVAVTDGEAHRVRHELVGAAAVRPEPNRRAGGRGRPLACFGHLTDLQLADVQSPLRFEFLNREVADPRLADLIPMHRPQEGFAYHAAQAMVDALNSVPRGPVTGAALELVVTTGDAIDNAQWNELRSFLALMESGEVRPGSGAPGYHGVQSRDWPDDIFWVPEGGHDPFNRRGYRTLPGILDVAMTAWQSAGLRMPWLACYGNHEALIAGVGAITTGARAGAIGSHKPIRLRPDLDRDHALVTFVDHAESFIDAETRWVPPDPERRLMSRRQFIEAHFSAGARPYGHGFTERNLLDGTAYYAHDVAGVRFITLDTTNAAGVSDGCLDAAQVRWLEQQLDDCEQPGTERLVVLLSHHGIDTLTNLRGQVGADGEPLTGAIELRTLLHRHPSVVLWVNGHTHINQVRPRPHPSESGRGFWEVTTCSIADWPSQARLVEILDSGDGELSIVCTMLDHGSPVVPDLQAAHAGSLPDLASLHREIAGNSPRGGFDSSYGGSAADRNVELRLRVPFALTHLPSLT